MEHVSSPVALKPPRLDDRALNRLASSPSTYLCVFMPGIGEKLAQHWCGLEPFRSVRATRVPVYRMGEHVFCRRLVYYTYSQGE